ncbi:hypothetical protein [Micromonospora sp. LOL_024]|uniref:hypothetical protein n=1 Tax=Micromonospora sp. LOL_024 TaxID=3345412 RepID=UPI003A869BB5
MSPGGALDQADHDEDRYHELPGLAGSFDAIAFVPASPRCTRETAEQRADTPGGWSGAPPEGLGKVLRDETAAGGTR